MSILNHTCSNFQNTNLSPLTLFNHFTCHFITYSSRKHSMHHQYHSQASKYPQ
ncbi:hypothetical protein F383_28385 [Gossypium arboreum]|uniref:Uncharacterized protein n=1 Tax=Gossypium arboreum TaxID=29729 RepID=A0A0B0PA55_GOSAR|nr:hypothetical protein F383_28385 [Gossypium arboreum]